MSNTYQFFINQAFTKLCEELLPRILDIESMDDVMDFIGKQVRGGVLKEGDKIVKWSNMVMRGRLG